MAPVMAQDMITLPDFFVFILGPSLAQRVSTLLSLAHDRPGRLVPAL